MTQVLYSAELSGKVMVIRLRRSSLKSRFPDRGRREVDDLLTVHRQVVLDLAEITTTAGMGLQVIVEWIKVSQSAGNVLVLAQCSRQMLSLLGILRISREVAVLANLQDAFAHFEAGVKAVGHHA